MIAGRDAVATCYEIFLGRDLDSMAVAEERGAWPLAEVIASFIDCEEFEVNVLAPLGRSERLPDWLFHDRPRVRHRMWIADQLPLLASAAEAIVGAEHWDEVLRILVGDPLLMSVGGREPIATKPRDGADAPRYATIRDDAANSGVWRRRLSTFHAKLIDAFEPLGDNCEFGGLQRAAGIEQLSLFRWSGVTLDTLVHLLDADLEGVDDPAHVHLEQAVWRNGAREYMVRHDAMRATSHTFQVPDDRGAEGEAALLALEVRRLGLLRRKFLEDVRVARRIFVYRCIDPVDPAAMLRLHRALARYGPNRLLFVRLADAALAAGEVRSIASGIVEGAMDSFALGIERFSELWPLLLYRAHARFAAGSFFRDVA